jgi:hypothetical protein
MVKSFKDELLKKYEEEKPTPFLQFSSIVKPDSDNCYDVNSDVVYELIGNSPNVRLLITPETPKEEIIGSLIKIIYWISNQNILETLKEDLKREEVARSKPKEIETKLKESGYTGEQIAVFCKSFEDPGLEPF